MLTVTEFAATLTARNKKKKGVTRQHVLYLLKNGRIRGAMKVGEVKGSRGLWLIPENAQVLDSSNGKSGTK